MSGNLDLTLLRHAESEYNQFKMKWETSELYQKFLSAYKADWQSDMTKDLAIQVALKFSSFNTDHSTDITDKGRQIAKNAAQLLSKAIKTPDVVVVSPYLRTQSTWEVIREEWPQVQKAKVITDELIREQEFGLRLLYGDWRAMQVCHPEQRSLYRLQGPYWYRHPQGENIPDVRARVRQWMDSALREYAGKRVLVITHHVTILSFIANIEHLTAESFNDMYKTLRPDHCAITQYQIKQDGKYKQIYLNKELL